MRFHGEIRSAGQDRRWIDPMPLKTANRTELTPGTVLVREWDRRSHRVMVVAGGFAWNGQTTEFLDAETGPKSPPETTDVPRDQKGPEPIAEIPAQTAYLSLMGKYAVRQDWVVADAVVRNRSRPI